MNIIFANIVFTRLLLKNLQLIFDFREMDAILANQIAEKIEAALGRVKESDQPEMSVQKIDQHLTITTLALRTSQGHCQYYVTRQEGDTTIEGGITSNGLITYTHRGNTMVSPHDRIDKYADNPEWSRFIWAAIGMYTTIVCNDINYIEQQMSHRP